MEAASATRPSSIRNQIFSCSSCSFPRSLTSLLWRFRSVAYAVARASFITSAPMASACRYTRASTLVMSARWGAAIVGVGMRSDPVSTWPSPGTGAGGPFARASLTPLAGVFERDPALVFFAGSGVGGTFVSTGGPPTVGRKPCGDATSFGSRWSGSARTARFLSRWVARGTGSGEGTPGASGSGLRGLASSTFLASSGIFSALLTSACVPLPPAVSIGLL